MSLEQVKNEILQEARKKAEKIEQEGSEKKKELIEEAEEEAEKIKKDAKEEAKTKAERMERKELSKTRLEQRKKNLDLKSEKIDEVLDEFESELEGFLQENTKKILQKIKDDSDFEIGKVKVGQEQDLNTDLEVKKTLEEPGLVAVSSDGSRQVSYTLTNIMSNFKKNHRQELAKILFDE